MPGVSSADELLGGLLRGGQPARCDVGGPHRLRHVDHEHHHRAVARDADVVGGSGHRDGQQGERRDQQDRRQVPPPGRPFGRNTFQQLHVGESQHALLPRQLHDDVEPDQREDRQDEQEVPRVCEAAQRHRPEQWQCHESCVVSVRVVMPESSGSLGVIAVRPSRRGAGTRRTARCRRSSRGRCAGSAGARRSGAACVRPHRRAPRPHGRSRHATVRRW